MKIVFTNVHSISISYEKSYGSIIWRISVIMTTLAQNENKNDEKSWGGKPKYSDVYLVISRNDVNCPLFQKMKTEVIWSKRQSKAAVGAPSSSFAKQNPSIQWPQMHRIQRKMTPTLGWFTILASICTHLDYMVVSLITITRRSIRKTFNLESSLCEKIFHIKFIMCSWYYSFNKHNIIIIMDTSLSKCS